MTPLSNSEYIKHVIELENSSLPKVSTDPPAQGEKQAWFFTKAYWMLKSYELSHGATVLDYGCSMGTTVNTLLARGYNAFGVDILEYWGKDQELCGRAITAYPPEITSRLMLIDADKIRLPFDDHSVDFIVSDQTFEHVFDYEPVFREHRRVLKRGGLAVHRFPRRYALLEVHTRLPIALMNRYNWYLSIWAIAGFRTLRQQGLPWRDTVKSNRAVYATTNYASPRTILASARRSGLSAHFMDHLSISDSRIGRLYRHLERFGLARFANPFLMAVTMNQVLVLEAVSQMPQED